MNTLKEISIDDLSFNPFNKIGKEWFLITSGNISNYNTMTASWGMMGFLWGKPVINCFVRPQRYTFDFIENNDLFTISFFENDKKDALTFCGTKSGRDYDKAKETGLTPLDVDNCVTFSEASLVFVCKKMYTQNFEKNNFLQNDNVEKWYANNDFHKSYIGEIIKIYSK